MERLGERWGEILRDLERWREMGRDLEGFGEMD